MTNTVNITTEFYLFLSIYQQVFISLSIILSFFPACQKHRHICAPLTTTRAEVYLNRKLPSSCLTYLRYCHHQIFIWRGEDLWMATFLLLCSIYTTFCTSTHRHKHMRTAEARCVYESISHNHLEYLYAPVCTRLGESQFHLESNWVWSWLFLRKINK